MKKNVKAIIVGIVFLVILLGFGWYINSNKVLNGDKEPNISEADDGNISEAEDKSQYNSDFGKDDYVRSVTYFGNDWVINFWNSDFETLDEDFNQIKNDGFNSIILVIPWKEFQTSTDPIEYSDYAFDNLDKVVKKASEYALDVYVRIGYPWDYYNDFNESISERILDLLRKEKVQDAWMDYCRVLYEKLSAYDNFKDGFLTWEDLRFWMHICSNQDESKRLNYAKDIGYQDWVNKHYSISEYNDKYAVDYKSIEDIPVPYSAEDSAMEEYYKFCDAMQNELLTKTQKVFPNISMEVRMDWDGYKDVNGEQAYYSHEITYTCGESDYTATMYGIPMGFENKGERVSADEAMSHTEYMLKQLLENNDGKPIYVEQFLFKDNTPGYSSNAQIIDEEVGKYVEDVAGILGNYTKGYGLWTYRDYRTNILYNPQFSLGDIGWTVTGNPTFDMDNKNNHVCTFSKGDTISQIIPTHRNKFPMETCTFELNILQTKGAVIEVTMGDNSCEINASKEGKYEVTIPDGGNYDFSLHVVDGEAIIDDLYLYSFVQEGSLYDVNNREEELVSSLRILNQKLAKED